MRRILEPAATAPAARNITEEDAIRLRGMLKAADPGGSVGWVWRGITQHGANDRTIAEHAAILAAARGHDAELPFALALAYFAGIEQWLRSGLTYWAKPTRVTHFAIRGIPRKSGRITVKLLESDHPDLVSGTKGRRFGSCRGANRNPRSCLGVLALHRLWRVSATGVGVATHRAATTRMPCPHFAHTRTESSSAQRA